MTERRGELIGDALGEVGVGGVAAHGLEREHGEGLRRRGGCRCLAEEIQAPRRDDGDAGEVRARWMGRAGRVFASDVAVDVPEAPAWLKDRAKSPQEAKRSAGALDKARPTARSVAGETAGPWHGCSAASRS
jgi:hypothetical protein